MPVGALWSGLLLMAAAQAPAKDAATDDFLTVDHLLVDTLLYENVALTRVRVIVRNDLDVLDRAVALSLLAPEDAVVYEFDAYGTVDPDREVLCTSEDGIATYVRMVDAIRIGAVGKVESKTVKFHELAAAITDVVKELQKAPFYKRATITFNLLASRKPKDDEDPLEAQVTTILQKQKVANFSVRMVSAGVAALLQKSGAGRFQVMAAPLPMGAEHAVEIFFCQFSAMAPTGAYEVTLPFALDGRLKVLKQEARVRIISSDEIGDARCLSHIATAVAHPKTAPFRAELRIPIEVSPGTVPVRISYRLGAKAKPAGAPDPAASWPVWPHDKRGERDPLFRPSSALASVLSARVLEALAADAAIAPEARDKRVMEAGGKGKCVTTLSSILVAGAEVFGAVGRQPPREPEVPFRSERIIK